MIVDIFLLLVGSILYLISGIFGLVTWALPEQFFTALGYVFEQLAVVEIFVPVSELMQALTVFLTFITFWYGIKIIMWTYHLIRHGGKTHPAKMHD